jgi:hypothetical protein
MKYELQDNSARFEEDMNFASIKLNNGMDGANSSIQERERLEKQEAIKKPMPIGSVVTTDSNALKMIIGFKVNENGQVYDYMGCDYPFGVSQDHPANFFNHSDIKRIYHVGFVNNQELEFKSQWDLNDQVSVMGR